ncbi:NUDIX hydrolase [Salirhabdus sp. Marseille-P4669]|uniref:NUDIX hydrolase n=1 Tax=Salirhabdus sp. Marseille-P4669 TaxID=2042310 RepID=UPI000C7C3E9A|nr:NUDIX hydrolase [Salirhabdus sp. Marseille-P4669]
MISIPKPASTVILMDQQNNVYLTKRPVTMKFLGGFFVFPGGSVDEKDSLYNDKYFINCPKDSCFDFSYYIAAARELFEEVGVLLVEDEQIPADAKWHYRKQLIKGDITFLHFLESENVQLDLGKLHYFGHRITPETQKYRYDTRFFIAKMPPGQTPQPEETEIDEAYWASPTEALTAFDKGEIALAPPTKASLKTIANYLVGSGPLVLPERKNESELRN